MNTAVDSNVADNRRHRGVLAYHAGASAERQVEDDYARRGYPIARRRWRGQSGEVDLIVHDGDGLVFVEVKKSRDHARAMEHLTPRQINRIWHAAEEYLTHTPRGALTDVRIDVALVDTHGQISILENAYMA